MKTETMATTLELLSAIECFSALDPISLQELAEGCERRDLVRGDLLIQEGAAADEFFVVLRGRFVVLKDGAAIAEIGPGEPIGELAFFAGGMRTASVKAARDSSTLVLRREIYDRLASKIPALSNGILVALSRRLARTVRAMPTLRPRVGRVCLVLPGSGGRLPDAFVKSIREDFRSRQRWQIIGSDHPAACAKDDVLAIRRRIENTETESDYVLLLVEDVATNPAFCDAAIAVADTIVVLRETIEDCALSKIERQLITATLPANLHLALWRPSGSAIRNTASWLAVRPVALHHHLEEGRTACVARLGRFLRGEALGFVFSGGGAHGCAHLGVIKAIIEQGIELDFLGGTSIGAAIAAALAIGYDPEGVLSVFEDIFLRQKAMAKLNLPRYSFLDHRLFDQTLIDGYLGSMAEDAAINFFAVTTSLTTNEMVVLRRGAVWEAVRASTSLPAIFPPFVTKDGHVWVDGGLIDNAPVEVMRQLKSGPNVVLNLTPQAPMVCDLPYEQFPGPWDVIRSLVSRRRRPSPPSLYSVLANSMVINSRSKLAQVATEGDVLLAVDVPEGMSFLDWTRGREAFNTAYAAYSRQFTGPPAAEVFDLPSRLLRLRVNS